MLHVTWNGDLTHELLHSKGFTTDIEKQIICPTDLVAGFNIPLIMLGYKVNVINTVMISELLIRIEIESNLNANPLYDFGRVRLMLRQRVFDSDLAGDVDPLKEFLNKLHGLRINIDFMTTPEWMKSAGLKFPTKRELKNVV